MALSKTYASWELLDGTTHDDVRILAADKVRAEGVCQKQGWKLADGPRLHTTLVWAAAKRLGLTEADLADYVDGIADYAISNDDPEAEDEPDPT